MTRFVNLFYNHGLVSTPSVGNETKILWIESKSSQHIGKRTDFIAAMFESSQREKTRGKRCRIFKTLTP